MAGDDDVLMLPKDVARLFKVDPKTVARWARSGTLPYIRLPSGHRRYRTADVRKLLEAK